MTFNLDIRAPLSSGLLWARRLFPYFVFLIGTLVGAGALMRLLAGDVRTRVIYGAILVGALLLFWLVQGLLERNTRSWRLYQNIGAALTGSVGFLLILMSATDVLFWLFVNTDPNAMQPLGWFSAGIVLLIWAISLIWNNGTGCLLWQIALLPIGSLTLWWWRLQSATALQQVRPEQVFQLLLPVTGWFCGCIVLVLFMSRRAARRTQPLPTSARQAPITTRTFPTRYHELLARGRLCELFEQPCAQPCPLSTSIVVKYQKRRIQYQLYPEILEPFEKAYAMLVTPQSRELCKIAHEILQAKAKQLGAARYHDVEVYLWSTLWERLHDQEYRGDPHKVMRDKQQLIKELNSP